MRSRCSGSLQFLSSKWHRENRSLHGPGTGAFVGTCFVVVVWVTTEGRSVVVLVTTEGRSVGEPLHTPQDIGQAIFM